MIEISKDLAAKALNANLRNLIKKLGEGGTLGQADSEALHRALLNGEISDDLKASMQRAREAALIRKRVLGGRLTQEEQDEIAHLLPDGRSIVRKQTSATYKLTIREYAEQLQAQGMAKSEDAPRKLKGWISKGRHDKEGNPRAEPDYPPFDQFDQLAAWWRRNMTYKVPDYLVRLEREAAHEPQSSEATGTPPSSENKGAPAPEEFTAYGALEFNEDVAGDFGVRISRSFAHDSLKRFEAARKAGNLKLARQCREELREDIEDLRKQESAALKVMEGKGEYLRTRVLMTDANRLFAMMSISFYNALEMVIKKAAPLLPATERRDLALDQRDIVFEHLQTTKFAEAWSPAEDPA
jgi:hypothetical protein